MKSDRILASIEYVWKNCTVLCIRLKKVCNILLFSFLNVTAGLTFSLHLDTSPKKLKFVISVLSDCNLNSYYYAIIVIHRDGHKANNCALIFIICNERSQV